MCAMLTVLGNRRNPGEQDLVDLLSECHDRIRRFVALAREAATRHDVPADQISRACADVERYFTAALPLHVADEEESIAPRLRGLSSEVDRALDKMEDQHQGHAPKIEALLGVVAEVGRDPSDQDRRRALAGVAADLEVDLEQHLALEEAILFPAVRDMLSRETQTQVMEELRQRRRQNGPHAVATGTGTRSESA